jgi:hydrogenase nickel incorporation protein HypA/HybF
VHELSIAQGILDIVYQNLPKDREVTVRSVRLRIGAIGGVVTDSLEFCFSAITQGTPLQGVTLEIERVPLVVHCKGCGKDSEIEQTVFACPACAGLDLTMLSGNEMQVKDIEIDDGDPA